MLLRWIRACCIWSSNTRSPAAIGTAAPRAGPTLKLVLPESLESRLFDWWGRKKLAFAAHRAELLENPEHMTPAFLYCAPHAAATAGGFLVGVGVGLLLPATLATQIVELALLAAVMITDFVIVHVLRRPPEEDPPGPPMWPESARNALELAVYF